MNKTATLYRMETDKHICPFGLRAKDLLRREGYSVDDCVLTTRKQADDLKASLKVQTTPQVIINGERIGGFEDLKRFFGKNNQDKAKTSYFPVISLFLIAALITGVLAYSQSYATSFQNLAMQFIGFSMTMLGLLKLQNVDGFVNGFLGYDLLAQRYVPYAYLYPFAEVLGGLLMIGNILPAVSIPLMLFIGGIGGISVFKAVYLDKRELKCACVGGGSNVPLGFVSFSENAVMFGAAVWMLLHSLL